MFSFLGKVVVITGGAGGIGQALSQQLIKQGARVVVLDLNVTGVTSSDSLFPLATDITCRDQLANALEKIIERFGTIDALFNNAGITHMSQFVDTPASLFEKIMAVNFNAAVNITRLCLPYILQNQGRIVVISSVAGFAPLYGRSAYSASKHALEGFFGSLASELKEAKVGITIVSPSFVRSRPDLRAQVNGGATSPGALKKNTSGKQVSPENAAAHIIKATQKGQSNLFLGKVAKIARWLVALAPGLYMTIMTRGAKQEFE
jgi:NAD(P)-dependent dehydrogenase (short-subunit alcohol dehydrogenase family)